MGNISWKEFYHHLISVHPHRRGEHDYFLFWVGKVCGSSPQAWGTSSVLNGGQDTKRFIPTGVGNIYSLLNFPMIETVHPHRRGEHRSALLNSEPDLGSSPQAWGTYVCNFYQSEWRRFIPTGVGNIHASGSFRPHHPVHPHRRGEHSRRRK